MPGLPALSFVNDVEMSRHDGQTVYVVADNHKNGDFTPYVFASTDLGRSWRLCHSVTCPRGRSSGRSSKTRCDLTSFFSARNSASTSAPIMARAGTACRPADHSFRDIQLQRRDGDLIGASFGRGIFVLDDYSPLRDLTAETLAGEGTLFPIRKAWWYIPFRPGQAPGRSELGSDDFKAANPPHGALFTYYLREVPKTAKAARHETEKALREKGADVPFPGIRKRCAAKLSRVRAEGALDRLRRPRQSGAMDRRAGRAGLHRLSWDLRGPSPEPVEARATGLPLALGISAQGTFGRAREVFGGAGGGERRRRAPARRGAIVRSGRGAEPLARHRPARGRCVPAEGGRSRTAGGRRGG